MHRKTNIIRERIEEWKTEISKKRKWSKVKSKTGCKDKYEKGQKRKIQDTEIACEKRKPGYRRKHWKKNTAYEKTSNTGENIDKKKRKCKE